MNNKIVNYPIQEEKIIIPKSREEEYNAKSIKPEANTKK
jgi:hypothetical protein